MKGNKAFWWVFWLGIGLRACLWALQVTPEGDDGMRYLSESVNMVKYGVFSTASFLESHGVPAPSAHDLPLWPSIMAVAYWITDSIRATQYIAGFINILLCATGALCLGSLLKDKPFCLSNKQVAIGCCVYLFMPESIMYSLCHMPDQLAVTSVIVGLWFYFRAVSYGNVYLVGTVISFVAAIYAKPICIPLTIALLCALVFLLQGKLLQRILVSAMCISMIIVCLYPWTIRNKMAFGTAGLTSISGTNLYSCNWGRLVDRLPEDEQRRAKEDMAQFEASIKNNDLMLRSKKQGEYAKKQLSTHLTEYALYTLKTHPRLYAGTGTVAMFRYLGMDRICDCLDSMWNSGNARGFVATHERPYTFLEKTLAAVVQIISWIVLLMGYVLVLTGIWRGLKCTIRNSDKKLEPWLVYLCPILCLLLLALVIGPITATRYRFIMIPFFSMLAARAIPMPYRDQLKDNS